MTDSEWVQRAGSTAKKTARRYVEYVVIAIGVLWLAGSVALGAWWAWHNPGETLIVVIFLVIFFFAFWVADDA